MPTFFYFEKKTAQRFPHADYHVQYLKKRSEISQRTNIRTDYEILQFGVSLNRAKEMNTISNPGSFAFPIIPFGGRRHFFIISIVHASTVLDNDLYQTDA